MSGKSSERKGNEDIAFICCYNNETELAEADFYIERLQIPIGSKIEKCYVQGAHSMTSGYQAAMRETNARYKVYLHQDVFVTDPDFLNKALAIFRKQRRIGMLGLVGTTRHLLSARYLDWDFGAVAGPIRVDCKETTSPEGYQNVVAADGFLLMTQVDLPWREDLFTAWDFYDISQCFEFLRVGYQIVVPNQRKEAPICYHDCEATKYGNYAIEREILREHYQDIYPFPKVELKEEDARAKRDAVLKDFYEVIKNLIDVRHDRDGALSLLWEYSRTIWGHTQLCHLKKIAFICKMEQEKEGSVSFWKKGDEIANLLECLRKLRFAIKRVEFDADLSLMESIFKEKQFSQTAIAAASVLYVDRREEYLKGLANILVRNGESQYFFDIQERMQTILTEIFKNDSSGVY